MMMLTEGRGKHAPKPWQYLMASHEMAALISEMRRRNGLRCYGDRQDQWGRGLSNAIVVPNGGGQFAPHEAAILTGFVGEYCSKSLINKRMKREVCNLDLTLLQQGDDGRDLRPCGLGTQVKCRQRNYGCTLIKENGPIRFSALIGCEWIPGTLTCSILGWQWASFIESQPVVPARKGGHHNREVPDLELLPFCSYIDELKSRSDHGADSLPRLKRKAS